MCPVSSLLLCMVLMSFHSSSPRVARTRLNVSAAERKRETRAFNMSSHDIATIAG